jgi:hypothetical protein
MRRQRERLARATGRSRLPRVVTPGGVRQRVEAEESARRFSLLRWLAIGVLVAAVAPVGIWSAQAPVWKDPLLFLPFYVASAAVGLVILLRRPDNRIAWLMLVGMGLIPLLGSAGAAYAEWAIPDHPGARLVDLGRWLGSWCFLVGIGLAVMLVLLFPDGRLPGPRWRWAFALAAIGICASWFLVAFGPAQGPASSLGNPYELQTLRPVFPVLDVVAPALTAVGTALAFLALVVRYQRSSGVERQQVMWLMYGAALALALTVPLGVTYQLAPDLALLVAWVVLPPLPLLVPVCTGVAVLRYRLYDIDRLVSRTLAYATLTVLIAVPYIGVVVVASRVAGDRGHVAVALATLAATTAFNPVRRRVQDRTDRRFNRARYDAVRTVDAFRAQLRHEVDLEQVRDGLLAAVRETVQPVSASVWLRRPSAGGPPH